MNLVPNFNVCEFKDLKSLDFYDVTGEYKAGINETGYNGPNNPGPSDVTLATISIILPKGTSPINVVVKGGTLVTNLPTIDGTIKFSITNILLGLGINDKLPDGIYDITYTLSGIYGGDTFEVTTNCQRLITGQVELCLDTKLTLLSAPTIDCEECSDIESDLTKINDLIVFLTASIYAASVYKINKAIKILDYVIDKCNEQPCTKC